MKTTELRIGNLLINGTVVGLTDGEIKVYDGYTTWSSEKVNFEPIPLREEWMPILGFEKDEQSYSNSLITIEFINDKVIVELKSRYLKDYNETLEHIKYVHQIQNLNYALDGAELSPKV